LGSGLEGKCDSVAVSLRVVRRRTVRGVVEFAVAVQVCWERRERCWGSSRRHTNSKRPVLAKLGRMQCQDVTPQGATDGSRVLNKDSGKECFSRG
jgi:hypothetical protein